VAADDAFLRRRDAMRATFAVVVAAGLVAAGCSSTTPELDQRRNLTEHFEAATKQCNVEIPPSNPKTAMARAECLNKAYLILMPIQPFPDLVQVYMAERLLNAERIQNGKMTYVEANAALARKGAELAAEDQRRRLASQAANAQQTAANAAAASNLLALRQHSCTTVGNTVNCF
jgi:hypothetical protein